MKNKIPEGYGLVKNIIAPDDSIVQNVLLIQGATGKSVKESKVLLSQETPFLLTLEEILKLQDAGVSMYYETYEQQQIRIQREKAQKEQEKKVKKAEAWYERLSKEEQSYVDVLIDFNSDFLPVAVD